MGNFKQIGSENDFLIPQNDSNSNVYDFNL